MTTLAWRLYALTAALLGAGLLITCLVLDRESRTGATRLLEAEGKRELDLLRVSAPRGAIARGDIREVDGWCDRVGDALDRRVTVIAASGRVLGDSYVPLDSIPTLQNHAHRPEVQEALRSGLGEAVRPSWTIRQKLFYIAQRLDPGARTPATVLRISMPIARAYALSADLQRRIWTAVAVVYLAVLLGGFWLARRVEGRLRALREAAEALSSGNLERRIPVEAHDELSTLARILNTMAESLAVRLAELNAERDTRDAVLANLPQGIALLSTDLAILHANGRFWDLVGVRPPGDGALRLASARQPALEEIALDAVRRGASVRREISLYVEEKQENEITVSPVPRGDGSQAWLLTIEDLHPERLAASLRREFIANASHELKTPLTSIRGYAETLLHGGLEDLENRARFVDKIRAQAERLEALVEDMLLLADLERPDAELDLKDWNLAEVARDMVASLENLAERRGLKLELTSTPGMIVRMDRRRIEAALRNLLDNALKHTDAGRVSVAVERNPSYARVTVADTGRGIGPEHLPRLFERFYRVDTGRSRALGGTGLGLAIVKHAVELHGGRVGVESAPGKGSAFWFEIPFQGPAGGRGGLDL
jgi:two-component system phosphate regulon sensor histidine kinase PhoR